MPEGPKQIIRKLCEEAGIEVKKSATIKTMAKELRSEWRRVSPGKKKRRSATRRSADRKKRRSATRKSPKRSAEKKLNGCDFMNLSKYPTQEDLETLRDDVMDSRRRESEIKKVYEKDIATYKKCVGKPPPRSLLLPKRDTSPDALLIGICDLRISVLNSWIRNDQDLHLSCKSRKSLKKLVINATGSEMYTSEHGHYYMIDDLSEKYLKKILDKLVSAKCKSYRKDIKKYKEFKSFLQDC